MDFYCYKINEKVSYPWKTTKGSWKYICWYTFVYFYKYISDWSLLIIACETATTRWFSSDETPKTKASYNSRRGPIKTSYICWKVVHIHFVGAFQPYERTIFERKTVDKRTNCLWKYNKPRYIFITHDHFYLLSYLWCNNYRIWLSV